MPEKSRKNRMNIEIYVIIMENEKKMQIVITIQKMLRHFDWKIEKKELMLGSNESITRKITVGLFHKCYLYGNLHSIHGCFWRYDYCHPSTIFIDYWWGLSADCYIRNQFFHCSRKYNSRICRIFIRAYQPTKIIRCARLYYLKYGKTFHRFDDNLGRCFRVKETDRAGSDPSLLHEIL